MAAAPRSMPAAGVGVAGYGMRGLRASWRARARTRASWRARAARAPPGLRRGGVVGAVVAVVDHDAFGGASVGARARPARRRSRWCAQTAARSRRPHRRASGALVGDHVQFGHGCPPAGVAGVAAARPPVDRVETVGRRVAAARRREPARPGACAELPPDAVSPSAERAGQRCDGSGRGRDPAPQTAACVSTTSAWMRTPGPRADRRTSPVGRVVAPAPMRASLAGGTPCCAAAAGCGWRDG